MKTCLNCHRILKTYETKYCSNKCQLKYQRTQFINKWKLDSKGIKTKNISKYIKKYLLQTFGEKCQICGWNKKNPITKIVPLEIDHINGNSENNNEKNLRLICPNCHSLSPYFRNLNKGKGRKWRNAKY